MRNVGADQMFGSAELFDQTSTIQVRPKWQNLFLQNTELFSLLNIGFFKMDTSLLRYFKVGLCFITKIKFEDKSKVYL